MTDTYVSPIVAAQAKIDNLTDLNKSLQFEIDAVRKQLETAQNMSAKRRVEVLQARIDKAEKYIGSLADDDEIDESVFINIANIFGWETTKEIEVTVTAVFKGTITVPRGFDADYLDENVNVECNLDSKIDGYLDCDEISVEVQK